MHQKNIAILIPCHNEEATIRQVVGALQAVLPAAVIYVYDNASDDATAEIAAAAGAIVNHEPLIGKGNVVKRMFSDVEADYYVMVDGDGTYDADVIPILVERCVNEGMDMMVGARNPMEGQKTYRAGHIFGNWFLNQVISFFFVKQFNDILSGCRVFSRRFVKSFPVLSKGFEIEAEMAAHALMLRLKVAEHPITYFPRIGGVSKLKTYKDGLRILFFSIRLFKDYRPLILFSTLSIVTFIATVIFFIPVFVEFLDTNTVSRIPTLIACGVGGVFSVLFLFTGFILDSIARASLKMKQLAYLQIKV